MCAEKIMYSSIIYEQLQLITQINRIFEFLKEKNVDRNELTDNYEQRLTLLIKENERISMAYGQKNEEIDSLNLKMKIIERERNEEIEDLQKQLKKSRFSNRVIFFL